MEKIGCKKTSQAEDIEYLIKNVYQFNYDYKHPLITFNLAMDLLFAMPEPKADTIEEYRDKPWR